MLEEDLMSALRNRDFEAVAIIADKLGKRNLLDLETAATQEARAEIYRKSLAIISEALLFVQTLRAHIATELHANTASIVYGKIDLEQHHWGIKA